MAYEQADYITIGGGLTGCALASGLRQGDPSFDILVLESGIDASDNPKTGNLEGTFALARSDLDYNCKSTPQPNGQSGRLQLSSQGREWAAGS